MRGHWFYGWFLGLVLACALGLALHTTGVISFLLGLSLSGLGGLIAEGAKR